MPKSTPRQPAMFPDASNGPTPKVELPQTVPVAEAVEAAKTGEPIAQPEPEPASSTSQEQSTPAPEQPPAQAEQTPPMLARKESLPFYPQSADEMWRYAKNLALSDLLPRGLRNKVKGHDGREHLAPGGKVADIYLVLLKGHDFGLKPLQSIASINIIEGKAEVGALMMLALVQKSGLCAGWELVKSDSLSAIYRTKRVGSENWVEFEYTIEEAEQMGLLDKGKTDWEKANNNWRKQPRTMLRRRCMSNLLREVYSDIVLGLYDHDELQEIRDREVALGIDPDRVIAMNGITAGQPALAEADAPGLIAKLQQSVDPLKERLKVKTGGLVRRCSQCQAVLDPRDSDPCIACRPVEQ